MTQIKLISIDEEILFAIYPLEIEYEGHRYSGRLESKSGNLTMVWQSRVPADLAAIDVNNLMTAAIREIDQMKKLNARQELLLELQNIKESF